MVCYYRLALLLAIYGGIFRANISLDGKPVDVLLLKTTKQVFRFKTINAENSVFIISKVERFKRKYFIPYRVLYS